MKIQTKNFKSRRIEEGPEKSVVSARNCGKGIRGGAVASPRKGLEENTSTG